MEDYILHVTAAKGTIRGFFANTKNTVNEGFKIHSTSPVVSAALGRMLTAAAIMGTMLKNEDDLVTLSIKGDGPMKGVTVTANKNAGVKGYVYENMVDLPLKANGKLDVSSAIGEGVLSVMKDIGLKDPYVGEIPLVSGEVADDLTYYFSKSEQTPSTVALGVLVDRDYTIKQAGGFIIQLMPGVSYETIDILEQKLIDLPPITALLEQGKTMEDIAQIVLGDFDYNVKGKSPVNYYCNCDRARVEKALISVGKNELENILLEDEKANLHCHFCNKDYLFSKEDIIKILESIRKN